VLFVLLCGKLLRVITEEPSQQITPLSEEPVYPPAPVLGPEVQPSPTPESLAWWLPWIEVGKAVALWVVSVLLLLFVPVIVALPYLIYKIVASGAASSAALATDKTVIFLSVVAIIPTHLLTLLATWAFVTNWGRRPFWKTLKFEWPKNVGPVVAGLLSMSVAIVLLMLAWLVTNHWGGAKTQLDVLIESSMPTRFATAFIAVATAPLVEELIYRGVLYPAIEKAAGVTVAVVAVSLLFAGVHVFQYINNIAVITAITLLSFTLTMARAYTGKLLPSFVIHLVFNGIQSLILVLAPFLDKGTG
jgi:membrane protease YdiL (CAAX protease family)